MIIKGKRLSMHVFVCLSVYVSKGKRGDGKEREGGWVGRGRWRERERERERERSILTATDYAHYCYCPANNNYAFPF